MESTPTENGPSGFSVLDPVSHAVDRTVQVLFRPFDIGKWFTLGFCAWLAWLGQGGGGSGSSRWTESSDRAREGAETAWYWIQDHLVLVIAIALVLCVVIVGLLLLFTWLSSRGKFMFLDGVVHDRGAVVEPWHRFRERGNSLFGFRIVLVIVALITMSLLIVLAVLNLLSMGIWEEDPGAGFFVVVGLWLLVIVGVGIAFGLVGMAANDFVVPIMWVRDCRVMDAWSEFLSLLSSNPGIFVLYVLLKFLFAVVIAVIACFVTCATCCIAAIPYIGTVILLPLFVFRRSYSMFFLNQFDPDYAAFGPGPPVSASTAVPEDAPPDSAGES